MQLSICLCRSASRTSCRLTTRPAPMAASPSTGMACRSAMSPGRCVQPAGDRYMAGWLMCELQRGCGQSATATDCFWVLQDGVAFVHQCPIMPGHEFTYRFPITDSPGTCEHLRHLMSMAAAQPSSFQGHAFHSCWRAWHCSQKIRQGVIGGEHGMPQSVGVLLCVNVSKLKDGGVASRRLVARPRQRQPRRRPGRPVHHRPRGGHAGDAHMTLDTCNWCPDHPLSTSVFVVQYIRLQQAAMRATTGPRLTLDLMQPCAAGA